MLHLTLHKRTIEWKEGDSLLGIFFFFYFILLSAVKRALFSFLPHTFINTQTSAL